MQFLRGEKLCLGHLLAAEQGNETARRNLAELLAETGGTE